MSDLVFSNPAFQRSRRVCASSSASITSITREADDLFSGLGGGVAAKPAQGYVDLIQDAWSRLAIGRATAIAEESGKAPHRVVLAELVAWLSSASLSAMALGWRSHSTAYTTGPASQGVSQAVLQWLTHTYTDSPLSRAVGAAWASRYDRAALAARVRALLLDQPLEDGQVHDAELLLEQAVASRSLDGAWVTDLVDQVEPKELPALVIVLARVGLPGASMQRAQLLRSCLDNGDASIRVAAVQALELWADKALLTVATNHQEGVPWIRDYLAGVIRDIASVGS